MGDNFYKKIEKNKNPLLIVLVEGLIIIVIRKIHIIFVKYL